MTFGANSDLFAALVSFCVSVVRGFVVRPLFCLFQATYRFTSVQVACAKRWKLRENKAYLRQSLPAAGIIEESESARGERGRVGQGRVGFRV